MFLFAVYLAALGVLLPAIGQTFGLGSAAQGQMFPANFAGFIAVVLVAGPASDRFNRKNVLVAGVGLFAVGLALFSRAPNFPLALAASFLIGGGGGAVGVTASALAAELYVHRRAHILAVIQVAFGLGAALGPGVASVLLSHQVRWRVLYAGLALLNFALALALQTQNASAPTRNAPPLKPQRSKLPAPSMRSLLAERPVQLLCLFQVCYGGAEVGYFSWMPTYFERHLPGGTRFAGVVVTVFWIAMTIGRSVTAKNMARIHFMRWSARLAVGGAVCASLTLVWQSPVVVMVFVALTALCFSGIYILLTAEASNRYPTRIGAVLGCMVAVGSVGTALIPWAVGAIAATGAGWMGGLALIPCAALGVAICALLLQKQK
jgi:FHS family glucose/mannose:H+ symporter-like MFS transporter